jgi:hypothetical protein
LPTTAPDIVLTPVDTAVLIDPLANDSGEGLVLEGFTQPAHGTLITNPDHTLTYTPAPGFIGVDAFTYTVRDATGATATGSVTISVLAPNQPPVANDDAATAAGAAIEIPVLANDHDPDGDPLRLVAIGQPAHGTASFIAPDRIRYQPQPGFSGIDRFTYTIDDGDDGIATGTVTVRVEPTNHDPLAAHLTVDTTEGTPLLLDLLAHAHDPDGDALRLEALAVPQHGRLTVNADRTVTYTPQPGWSGSDSFSWTVGDGRGGLATGTVQVRVVRPNLPPAANDDQLTTPQDTPLAFDPLANDSDPEGDPVRLTAFGLPRHGRLDLGADGRLTYTPDPGFSGEDSFTYTIDDGRGGTATGAVRITVTPAEPPAEVFANGFRFRRRLLLPARQQVSEVITGFVLLVKEAGDWLRSAAHGGQIESPDGYDLRFELADGTKLAHEIERYDPVSGELVAWVRIPAWDIATSLTLFLYYGKAGLTASEADPAATWQDYLAVWDPLTGRDRSGNGRHLVATGVVPDELVGPAGRFDGTAGCTGSAHWLAGLSQMTAMLTLKADVSMLGSNRRILIQGADGAADSALGLMIRYADVGFRGGAQRPIVCGLRTDQGLLRFESVANTHTTEPQVLHLVWQAGQAPRVYQNGTLLPASWQGSIVGTQAVADTFVGSVLAPVPDAPLNLGIGASDPSRAWSGLMAEVRVLPAALSATQTSLEARNHLTPRALYGLGDGEQPGETDASPVAIPLDVTVTSGGRIDIDLFAALQAASDTVLVAIGQAAHGDVTLVHGRIRYVARAGFIGADHFTYTIARAGKVSTGAIFVTVTAQAAEYPPPARLRFVATYAQLQAAVASLAAGDHVVLEDGTYSGPQLTLSASDVVIRAKNINGARVPGTFKLNGNRVVLWGIDFSYQTASLQVAGNDNVIRRCRFRGFGTHIRLLTGQRAKILYCDFSCPTQNPEDPDTLIIASHDGSAARHTDAEIGWCYFHDMPPKTDNYGERKRAAISLGNSPGDAAYTSNFYIHHCLFERCGECELSLKTRGNRVEYCTGIGDKFQFRIRQGGDNQFLGCWLENARAYELMGDDNIVRWCKAIGSTFNVWAGQVEAGNTTSNGIPRALRTTLIGCDGPVVVGEFYANRSDQNLPAKDTVLRAHTGSITLKRHHNTQQFANANESPLQPVRLSPAEVGQLAS